MDALVKDDFAVARYNTDGSLDTTFGIGGRVTTDLSGWDRAYALAIQSDGKIVVAGEDYGGPISLLARYNGDGSLDMTFGVAGKVLTDFKREGARQMLWPSKPMAGSLQPVGRDLQTTFTQPVVWHYNRDGSPDTTFGIGGEVIADASSRDGFLGSVNALAILPDGKILAVGEGYAGSLGSTFGIVRYDADGSLDTTFGTATGTWIVTGIRAHKDAGDQDGEFVAVPATVTITVLA